MALNDTVQLAVIGTVGGQQHVHTLHFRYTDPTTSTDADLAADWEANVGDEYRGCFSDADNPTQLVRVSHVCGTIPLRAPAEVTPASAAGLRAAGSLGERAPSWLATVVSERTTLAGRSRRGRFYVGGLYEFDVNANDLAVGAGRSFTQVGLYTAALLARYGPTGLIAPKYLLVVHSRKLASVVGTQCQNSSTMVNGLLVRSAVGSQKSRKPGNGI